MNTADIQTIELEREAARRDAAAHLPECPYCYGVGAVSPTGPERYGVIIETCQDCDGLGRIKPNTVAIIKAIARKGK